MFGKKLSIGFGTIRGFRHPQGSGNVPPADKGDGGISPELDANCVSRYGHPRFIGASSGKVQ